MIWLVPVILIAVGFVLAVLAQGAASTWLWLTGTFGGIALMLIGGLLLGALVLRVIV